MKKYQAIQDIVPVPLLEFVERWALVGSRFTCDPAPTNTDQDVLILLDGEREFSLDDIMLSRGWVLGGSGQDDDQFESWTKGELNLIMTYEEEFYDRFWAATTVCKRLNLLNKEDRKAVFRCALYAEPCGYPVEVPF